MDSSSICLNSWSLLPSTPGHVTIQGITARDISPRDVSGALVCLFLTTKDGSVRRRRERTRRTRRELEMGTGPRTRTLCQRI